MPGAAGAAGAKGDKGGPGMTLRLVRPKAPAASCDGGEVMISAFCSGKFKAYPLTTTENGARCGPDTTRTAGRGDDRLRQDVTRIVRRKSRRSTMFDLRKLAL